MSDQLPRRFIDAGPGDLEDHDLGNGYVLAWNRDLETGAGWPMLGRINLAGTPQIVPCRPEHFMPSDMAPHELLGPLPEEFRQRLHIEEDA